MPNTGSMVNVRVTVMGATQLNRSLSRFGQDVKDFRPALVRIRDDFWKVEEGQFSTQGARGGQAWPPLSPSYLEWKNKYFGGRQILELTGELMGQLTIGVGMQVTLEPLTLIIRPTGFAAQKAWWHQRGTRRMPPRPVVRLTEQDRQRWTKYIHDYVYDSSRRRGLSR